MKLHGGQSVTPAYRFVGGDLLEDDTPGAHAGGGV